MLSQLTTNIVIKNYGSILTKGKFIPRESEIRGVFIFEGIYAYPHNWTEVANTLAEYGINTVFVNDQQAFQRRPDSEIRAAIDAFHSVGIQYHSVMAVLQDTKWPDGNTNTSEILSDGTPLSEYSHCPIKAHDAILEHLRDYLQTFPDVDGIMLDFIRYASGTTDVCFCEYCRQEFEAWYQQEYGEPVTNWTDFYAGGSKHDRFLEWRCIPVTRLVRDIHDTVRSINPNLVLSAAVYPLAEDNPIYWRKFLGQDTAKWVAEGYLDLVVPMIYVKTVTEVESYVKGAIKWWGAGTPFGNADLVAFLRNDREDTNLTPEELKAQIDVVRQYNLSGWIIWRYGGPGENHPGMDADIRDYLSIIDMPQTFSVFNIKVETTSNSATITWQTTLPSTSKVEYAATSFFNSSYVLWRGGVTFHYWNIIYTPGTVIEYAAMTTEHSVTLNNLDPTTTYYFRIQSASKSGIVTSKVLTFKTKG